jgi:hypothetical protein
MADTTTWTLIGRNGKPYQSDVSGTLGGHRTGKIYGLFSCRSALAAIARGGYVKNRVFFLDEATAIAAGYRPCASCMPDAHTAWKTAYTRKPKKRSGKRSTPVLHYAAQEKVTPFGFLPKKRTAPVCIRFGMS